MAAMGILFSHLSHHLQQRDVLKLSVSRKLFNSIGLYVPMLALVALAFITKEHATVAVALLTISVGINAATYLGFQVNHIDLAPDHAGVLMGITNCAANIMAIIAPLAVGYIVNESVSVRGNFVWEDNESEVALCVSQGNVSQWRIVFFIAAGVYFVGNTMFVIFGETDVQPWNESQKHRKKQLEAEQQQQKQNDFGELLFWPLTSHLDTILVEDLMTNLIPSLFQSPFLSNGQVATSRSRGDSPGHEDKEFWWLMGDTRRQGDQNGRQCNLEEWRKRRGTGWWLFIQPPEMCQLKLCLLCQEGCVPRVLEEEEGEVILNVIP